MDNLYVQVLHLPRPFPSSQSLGSKDLDVEVTENTALIAEEKAETGNVKLSVIIAYCRACTWYMSLLTLLLYVLTNGASVASNFWLADWSNAEGNIRDSEIKNTTFVKLTACDKDSGPDV